MPPSQPSSASCPEPCPEPGRLKQLLDAAIPEAEQADLSAHVEVCEKCQQALETLAAGRETWLGAAQKLREAPEGPAPALEQAIEELRDSPQTAETHVGEASAELPLDFLAPPDDPAHLGKLDHYDVLEVVGRGAFGTVLRAFDQKLHRIVAIKVMSPQLASSVTARKRFIREGRAAAGVCHEHVVTIHAVEEETHPVPYLVMQFVQGASLEERLDRKGPPALAEILRIGMQAASGLAAAHAQGLVHRDIKPANILLENGVERVKITDFGLARAADDASLTQTGVIAGTPQYMAPEQARGEAVDHRADLFSLGSVLYTMCAGRPPFRASTTLAVLKRVCEETPRPLREINPEIPEWLAAIVVKLHAKDPAGRFQSAQEVSELLGRCLAHVQQPGQCPLPAVPAATPACEPAAPVARADVQGAKAAATISSRQATAARWLSSPLTTMGVIASLAVLLFIAPGAVLLQRLGLLEPATAETASFAGFAVAWLAQGAVLVVAFIQRIKKGAWAGSILGSGALAIVCAFAALDLAVGSLLAPAAKNDVREDAGSSRPVFSEVPVQSVAASGRLIIEADPRIRVEVRDPWTGSVVPKAGASVDDGRTQFDQQLPVGDYDLAAYADLHEQPWFRIRLKVARGQIRRLAIPTPDSDAGRFQGRWIVVSKEGSGQQLPADFWSGERIEFAGDQMRQIAVGGQVAEGIFALDSRRDPKQIDYLGPDGKPIEQGIYRLEGDSLTLCLGPTMLGKAALPRPDEFRTRFNSEVQLYVCRRAQTDLTALQGRWNVSSQDSHGRMLPESERDLWWETHDDLLTRSGSPDEVLRVEVENGTNPRQIDLFTRSGTPFASGIYQLEADRLIVCWGTPGQRPQVFPARAPAGQVVTMLSRPPAVRTTESGRPPRDIGGMWDSDWGEVGFAQVVPTAGRLIQVKGSYVTVSQGFHGELEGTLDPETGILETAWREREPGFAGTAHHVLSADGDTLTGTYRYGGDPDALEYAWNMTRKPRSLDPGAPTIAYGDEGLLVERGNLEPLCLGTLIVRYPCPFLKPPRLVLSREDGERVNFTTTKQTETMFEAEIDKAIDIRRCRWEATGMPREANTPVVSQLDFVTIDDVGVFQIRYPRAFAYRPNLQFPIDPLGFAIIGEDGSGFGADDARTLQFTISNESETGFDLHVKMVGRPAEVIPKFGWRATGVPKP